MSTIRQSYNMLSAGLPSNFTHNNPMGNIFSSAGIRNFGPMDGSGQLPSSSNLHGVLGSGIPGLAATSGTAGLDTDIRNFDHQRRRELFAAGMHDHHVKREEVDHHNLFGFDLVTFFLMNLKISLLIWVMFLISKRVLVVLFKRQSLAKTGSVITVRSIYRGFFMEAIQVS